MEQNNAPNAVPVAAPVPDLILPTGRIRLVTVAEGEATMRVGEDEYLDVVLPKGTAYELAIGRVFVARWRPSLVIEGVWSFFAEVGDEQLWIEQDGESGWIVNHEIEPPSVA